MDESIEQLVEKAKQGNRQALEKLIKKIQSRIYDLSLKMLGFAEDAEDATQEIIIKIITHLSSFRGESLFKTWSFRIAANHLLRIRQYRAEKCAIRGFCRDPLKR